MATTSRSGMSVHYEVEGQGPPVVLLHGMMSTSEIWRLEGYVGALRDEFRLILIDTRGHGRSDRPHEPAAYRYSQHAADVLAVLDDLGISSAVICGFSLGACTALRLAATCPDRVRALVLIGSVPEEVGFADVEVSPADDGGRSISRPTGCRGSSRASKRRGARAGRP